MALNPPLSADGIPLRVPGEYFVLSRTDMEFEIKISGLGTLTGKGNLILTTARMVLLNYQKSPKWRAFDIPLALMSKDTFEQPIFGANYICGEVLPLLGLLPGPATYKAWFMSGGCTKFLRCYHYVVDKLRAAMRSHTYASHFLPQFSSGSIQAQFTAFADANDPTVLFVDQPPVTHEPHHMEQYMTSSMGVPAAAPPRPAPVYVARPPVPAEAPPPMPPPPVGCYGPPPAAYYGPPPGYPGYAAPPPPPVQPPPPVDSAPYSAAPDGTIPPQPMPKQYYYASGAPVPPGSYPPK